MAQWTLPVAYDHVNMTGSQVTKETITYSLPKTRAPCGIDSVPIRDGSFNLETSMDVKDNIT